MIDADLAQLAKEKPDYNRALNEVS